MPCMSPARRTCARGAGKTRLEAASRTHPHSYKPYKRRNELHGAPLSREPRWRAEAGMRLALLRRRPRRPEARRLGPLSVLAAFLNEHPERIVEVEGHTDSTGTPAYNMDLSRARAEAVRTALVRDGVDPSR